MVKKLESILDLLRAFSEINKSYSIKEVGKKIGLSYQPIYTYLKRLASRGILKHTKEGNIHLYRLNLQNPFVIRELENIEFKRNQQIIESLKPKYKKAIKEALSQAQEKTPLLSAILFGSLARKTSTEVSDVDIFFVVSEINKNSEKIKRICNTLNMQYNVKISPIVVSLQEFRKMLLERETFIQNLMKEKIILSGTEFYFAELIKSMKELKWI